MNKLSSCLRTLHTLHTFSWMPTSLRHTACITEHNTQLQKIASFYFCSALRVGRPSKKKTEIDRLGSEPGHFACNDLSLTTHKPLPHNPSGDPEGGAPCGRGPLGGREISVQCLFIASRGLWRECHQKLQGDLGTTPECFCQSWHHVPIA